MKKRMKKKLRNNVKTIKDNKWVSACVAVIAIAAIIVTVLLLNRPETDAGTETPPPAAETVSGTPSADAPGTAVPSPSSAPTEPPAVSAGPAVSPGPGPTAAQDTAAPTEPPASQTPAPTPPLAPDNTTVVSQAEQTAAPMPPPTEPPAITPPAATAPPSSGSDITLQPVDPPTEVNL